MSGRRYIINQANKIPQSAPSGTIARRKLEQLVRATFANAAIAEELGADETSPAFLEVIQLLGEENLSQGQLQSLLDRLHAD